MSVTAKKKVHGSIFNTLEFKARSSKAAKKAFSLPHGESVRTILTNHLNGQNVNNYELLVVSVRDCEFLDDDILGLLREIGCCVPLLNADCRLLVEALLGFNWISRSDEVISVYQGFLVSLLSTHNFHTGLVFEKLVKLFLYVEDEAHWPNGMPSREESIKFAHIHWIFNSLFHVIPMCKEILMKTLEIYFPYMLKSSHVQEAYIHNLLLILDYQPKLRPEILRLIFSKLVLLDVSMPREEICKLEEDEEEDDEEVFKMEGAPSKGKSKKRGMADSLDLCLDKMFNYFIMECHNIENGELNWDKTKSLYHDVLNVFDQVILPTYNIHHVQFAMFTLCCLKPTIAEAFLNYLWKKVCNTAVPNVLRQSAVAYIASLVARAAYIPLPMLQGTLQQMASWIHSYIASQDGNEFVNADVRLHGIFYSVCQSLFYVVAFRQKDLVRSKKNISFLESLNLGKIVTCRLNPLRVCQPAIIQNFAAVTRTYQLAYCYSIMEHNSRNVLPTIYRDEQGAIITMKTTLDVFFPFDPYVLKRSGEKINPFYLHYREAEAEIVKEESTKCEMEDDDFLCDNAHSGLSKSLDRFSYGTSPGFKMKI